MNTIESNGSTKLLFAGPVGAGKTTAIRAISDSPPVSTDVPWTEADNESKTTTTVAFDYSSIRLDDSETLHVYGLPGQSKFDFMNAIIGRGALGAILLLDGSSPDIADDCIEHVRRLMQLFPGIGFVIGVVKTDLSPQFSMGALYQVVQDMALSAPIFTVDPRHRAQVIQLVRALLLLVE
jgi:signal recognition particle receptor subunit beta